MPDIFQTDDASTVVYIVLRLKVGAERAIKKGFC